MTTSAPLPPTDRETDRDLLARLLDEGRRRFWGRDEVLELSLTAFLAGGHVLLEDRPGVGKTTLALLLSRLFCLEFSRVQMTSDLLPADVLGTLVLERDRWTQRKGPIFTNVLLADEINRAPPRTQSGMLQAMEEGEVTLGDDTLALPSPFWVLATQNPLEYHGTYPLPENQLDRFLFRLELGYPDPKAEREAMGHGTGHDRSGSAGIPGLIQSDRIAGLRAAVDAVHVEHEVVDYLFSLVSATRDHPEIEIGASPRASTSLMRAARARSLLRGRDYVLPDDVRSVFLPGVVHRIRTTSALAASEGDRGRHRLLEEILGSVAIPR